jgi:ribonucleoside-diphosphate reductase alpha chain
MSEEKITIDKYFSKGIDPYNDSVMGYEKRDATVKDDSGKIIEQIKDTVFPSFWSQIAANTAATKYFRKEGVPGTGREIDIRQLAGRVGKKIASWGVIQNYLDEKQAKNLEEEIVAATTYQYGAFNSPVWFNVGLDLYGIEQKEDPSTALLAKEMIGRISPEIREKVKDLDLSGIIQKSGHFYIDSDGQIKKAENYYAHPQASACFIVSPEDSIESMIEVGAVTSATIFKGGSGIGGDWSHVRSAGEPVSGGGYASGAIRFMDVQDACGRVIKSGGKTRRAATMQSISAWHGDMVEVLKHKYKEEMKAKILIEAGSPANWESHTIQDLRAQNVNISIRTDDEFWKAYENNENYKIRGVVGEKILREEPAKKLAELMAFAAHNCGDPGIQNHSIINKWNTCKASGEIWASNPCSEYMFLNNSACNLASINLMRFRKEDGSFDLESFDKAVDLYITSQDIIVSQASYPTEKIAWNSYTFRPLGLGYANLGAYIMSLGLSYDSDEARELASAITSNMTAEAYLQSTRLAEKLGTFQEYEKNKNSMLEVMEMHRKATKQLPARNGLEALIASANKKWDEVIERGKKYGFRNSQVTLLAPTGTIGFMMDCDTTGCEPEFALKKYKELAGGGSMIIVNKTVPLALEKLGYEKKSIEDIVKYIDENGAVEGCKQLKDEHLPVFDCAVSSGKGERVISPMGHIRMLSAIQPYVSGAISKTINCPNNTTVEEIEKMFYEGWRLGVKALALYRDGSKAAQPLKTKKDAGIAILKRGEREHITKLRLGASQKVKIGEGDISLFIRAGEYPDGRLGEIFLDCMQRGSEFNRQLNANAIQFSEKLQYGVPLEEAIQVFSKTGKSQISGLTDHPFIKETGGIEGFVFDWIRAHYLGDISFVKKENPELRPLPWELIVYQKVPKLHLLPTVAKEKMYPGSPSLEETIERISGMNYWQDEGLDTRKTVEKIKKTRKWETDDGLITNASGKMSGQTCSKCGTMMESDGSCWKCPSCKTSTGGCGGG